MAAMRLSSSPIALLLLCTWLHSTLGQPHYDSDDHYGGPLIPEEDPYRVEWGPEDLSPYEDHYGDTLDPDDQHAERPLANHEDGHWQGSRGGIQRQPDVDEARGGTDFEGVRSEGEALESRYQRNPDYAGYGDVMSDYETGGEESDELDSFFWTDHLDKFGGMKVKEYANAAEDTWQDESGGGAAAAVAANVPAELRAPLVEVVSWYRATEFHELYWPLEIQASADAQRHSLERKGALATPDALAKVRQRNGFPHLLLLASEDIPSEEIILAVPHTLAISKETLKAFSQETVKDSSQETIKAFFQETLKDSSQETGEEDVDDSLVLTAWLLRERAKGGGSRWAAFLALLPERVPLPMLWTEQQLQDLDFAPAYHKAKEVKETVASVYATCDPEFIAFATLDQFMAALSVVWSHEIVAPRVSDDGIVEDPPINFLVPLGSLVESKAQGQATWQVRTFDEGEFLCLIAHGDISRGAPITVSNEPEKAMHFLMHRGTVPAEVPHDQFVVFGPTTQLVEYFADNFVVPELRKERRLPVPGVTVDQIKNEFVLTSLKAVERAVRLVLHSGDGGGGDMLPYRFGSKGFIDPKLWAAYAVCCFFKERLSGRHSLQTMSDLRKAEIDVEMVARVALDLADSRQGLTCGDLFGHAKTLFPTASPGEIRNMADAFEQASVYLKQLALVWIHGFRFSLEEDEIILDGTRKCSCGGNHPGTESSCPVSCLGTALSDEAELALRFRMNRKRLLIDVHNHLRVACPVQT